MKHSSLMIAAAAALAAFATPASAQEMDMDAMARWSAYEVVHYEVVGLYAAENVSIAQGASHWVSNPKVTDRVEIGFDWDQNQYQTVGTPTFRNFPATNAALPADAKCGAPRVTGLYDHITITKIGKAAGPTIAIETKRDYPAADIPYLGETECGLDHAAAKTEASPMSLLVPPTMYFGMPAAGGATVTVSKEKGTITLTDAANGWTWIYKPTPVR